MVSFCYFAPDSSNIELPPRWKLRKAIRVLNQIFNKLNLEQNPDKILISRVESEFYFLRITHTAYASSTIGVT